MDRSETTAARDSQPDNQEAFRSLLAKLKQTTSIGEKLQLLVAAHDDIRGLDVELHRVLSATPERQLMFDGTLKLLRLWWHHRRGEDAERDYYLHAFPGAESRKAIRESLGVRHDFSAEQIVFLITVDCMRGDHLSCNGYAKPTTPAIDRLAADGVNFTEAYSTAGQTAQSFPGILMSNFFQNFGRSRAVPEHLAALPEVLSRHGFRTVAFNAANPHVSHFYGYDRGFDEFHDFLGADNFQYADNTFVDNTPRRISAPTERELMEIFEDCQAQPDIYEILKQMTGREGLPLVRQIAQHKKFYPYDAADIVKYAMGSLYTGKDAPKQFFWLHLMDLHENITVPFSRLGTFTSVQQFLLNTCLATEEGRRILGAHSAKYQELYDSAVSYVDINVEVLHRFLADSGLLESSLLCVVADHGQELLERGVFGHGYDRLVEGLVHVPLIFSGGLARRIVREATDRPVSTLDVAPTILDVCGIKESPATFLGRTLNDTRPRRVWLQTFYDGADNRSTNKATRSFYLDPFPRPVKECCKQIVSCIDGGYQMIHDTGKGETELHRLAHAPAPAAPQQPPDADRLEREAKNYFEQVYDVPEQPYAFELSEPDKETVASRLQSLGYI